MPPAFAFAPHWYPLLPLEDLDPARPTAAELLGRPLVIWKPPGEDGFRVLLDRCPHRLAPLSEGRIDPDSGRLECAYHGWQFDGEGHCRRVPQADRAQLLEGRSHHLCATALPCCSAQGLLWVWPDPASAALAGEQPLPLSARVDAAAGYAWSSFVRDLPYDWRTLVENVCDPAHVPFAHHGIQGDRRRAGPLPLELVEEGLERLVAQVEGPVMTTRIVFEPPCRLEYEIDLPGDRRLGLVTYCLPVGPGRSRIVAQFPRNFARWQVRWLPRWWDHCTNRNAVIDGDLVLLHQQERELAAAPGGWRRAFRLPTRSDRLVLAFRRWLDRHDTLPWPAEPPAAPPPGPEERRRLLDRAGQHTRHCASCRGALKAAQRLEAGLGIALAAMLLALLLLPEGQRGAWLGWLLPLLAAGVLLELGIRRWLLPRLTFLDYVHAERP
ncbi:MAG: Rieske 2Fe-2S domain-containing protein [Synechococcus sp.]|nr:Rieske 2Fe-2S domain-containing protein [Synechococcus sp.]